MFPVSYYRIIFQPGLYFTVYVKIFLALNATATNNYGIITKLFQNILKYAYMKRDKDHSIFNRQTNLSVKCLLDKNLSLCPGGKEGITLNSPSRGSKSLWCYLYFCFYHSHTLLLALYIPKPRGLTCWLHSHNQHLAKSPWDLFILSSWKILYVLGFYLMNYSLISSANSAKPTGHS